MKPAKFGVAPGTVGISTISTKTVWALLIVSFCAVVFVVAISNAYGPKTIPSLTVTIFGTNDIHGGYYPTPFVRKDNS